MNGIAVLAYSGGLDTSCAIAWLKEDYGFEEVVAVLAAGDTVGDRPLSLRGLAEPEGGFEFDLFTSEGKRAPNRPSSSSHASDSAVGRAEGTAGEVRSCVEGASPWSSASEEPWWGTL